VSNLIAVAYPDKNDENGKVKPHQLHRPAARGAAGGALWGGGAALIVLIRKATPDKVLPEISQYGGEVIQTSLDDESEERLREVLEGKLTVGAAS